MFTQLESINHKPEPFEFYTAETLWNDPYISEKMLAFHLNESVDAASRNRAFLDKSIEWLATRFSAGAGARICDFGCGPGLYTLGLALRGAKVTGIDFSRRSIEYARRAAGDKGVDIQYVFGDYLQYETDEKFDLITLIMCDFCALSPAQRRGLLQKFRSLLKEGGAIIFDVYSYAAFDKWQEKAIYERRQLDGFWSADDYYGFVDTFKYPQEKLVLDKYTIVQQDRTWQVYNWFQCFSLNSLADELSACSLRISETLSDVAGSPYTEASDEFAVVVKAA